jgi:hypothetical protein
MKVYPTEAIETFSSRFLCNWGTSFSRLFLNAALLCIIPHPYWETFLPKSSSLGPSPYTSTPARMRIDSPQICSTRPLPRLPKRSSSIAPWHQRALRCDCLAGHRYLKDENFTVVMSILCSFPLLRIGRFSTGIPVQVAIKPIYLPLEALYHVFRLARSGEVMIFSRK